ncbi:MAG TPA: D-aminoacyl-tRNA deacylase [Solirubrobacterales bacterium]|jgi:D-tyrosyl-tRNA(Tyr) deacylase|nr:D-aminoacyl-tRNA deacylase [Solirubrobacterales bacterium]
MRALVQRVSQAAVDVEGERVAQIGPGLLVLLGVGVEDGEEQADRLADKVRALRIFDDAEGRMNEPLGDREVLCVSQFTLYGDARRGNRPSYVAAARPEIAEPLYQRFCERLGAKRGVFGACMGVALINDGPVTLMVEVERAATSAGHDRTIGCTHSSTSSSG